MTSSPTSTMRIGCAGWQVPAVLAGQFEDGASHLARYASRFMCSEINSSFYKAHRPATYRSWAAGVPEGFQFSVKMPKQVTHISRLADLSALGYFLADIAPLGERQGPLLMQLPPGFAFDSERVRAFLLALRFRWRGQVACEPRHPTWFDGAADTLLAEYEVARVAAHPGPTPAAEAPGGWAGLVYYRLHGAPDIYHSPYGQQRLAELAPALVRHSASAPTWCIFDNTATPAGVANALTLLQAVNGA